MPKFSRAVDALIWWFDHVDAARDFGQGCIPPPEDDEMVDESMDNWDYPEWWYTWLDLDMIFTAHFTEAEHVLMSYYLINIYGGDSGAFYRWQNRGAFNDVMKKLWPLIPQPYRGGRTKVHYARPKKGEINVAGIDPKKYYTTKEISDVLNFSVQAVVAWITKYGLKALKSPGETYQYRILGSDLIKFLTSEGEKNG